MKMTNKEGITYLQIFHNYIPIVILIVIVAVICIQMQMETRHAIHDLPPFWPFIWSSKFWTMHMLLQTLLQSLVNMLLCSKAVYRHCDLTATIIIFGANKRGGGQFPVSLYVVSLYFSFLETIFISGQPWRYFSTDKTVRQSETKVEDISPKAEYDGVNEIKVEVVANEVVTSTPQKVTGTFCSTRTSATWQII